MRPIGIYIHIPFCTKKCPYCDFYSLPYNEDLINQYVLALCKNIHSLSKIYNKKVDSIYLGGGTPNLIGVRNINKIIQTISNSFVVSNPEITMEMNPSCHDKINFSTLKNVGVNRLSIGMQSINEYELSILGRHHTPYDVKQALSKAEKADFYNISLDIMIATPSQKKSDLINSLKFCIENDLSHISVYLLKIEKNTPFFNVKERLSLPDEDTEANLYLFASEYLGASGHKHYEISNFCKKDMESRHNLKYWNCDEYLGIGPSAHSFIDGKRFHYPRSINKFINTPLYTTDGNGGSPKEYCMLRLRLADGIKNDEYKAKFGEDIPEIYYERARKYVNSGLVLADDSGIRLTYRGFLLSNTLILNIIY